MLEVLTGARTAAEASRQYQLSAQGLNRWKAQFLEEAPCILDNGARQSRPGHLKERAVRLKALLDETAAYRAHFARADIRAIVPTESGP